MRCCHSRRRLFGRSLAVVQTRNCGILPKTEVDGRRRLNLLGTKPSQACTGLHDGGAEGNRTPDLLIANETLYQLSYDPIHLIRRLLGRETGTTNRSLLPRASRPNAEIMKRSPLIASGFSRIFRGRAVRMSWNVSRYRDAPHRRSHQVPFSIRVIHIEICRFRWPSARPSRTRTMGATGGHGPGASESLFDQNFHVRLRSKNENQLSLKLPETRPRYAESWVTGMSPAHMNS